MKIEFFHDVICSFCFPMSYRMRQVKERKPELEIIHRSFALVPQVEAFDKMFGSRESAKAEILTHWEQANKNDDLNRFNIDGMKEKDFLFPTSIPPLRAVKAAEEVGGDDIAWDAFDALQNALFVENKNIEDLETIKEVLSKTSIDLEKWEIAYNSSKSLEEVNKDLALAKSYGISGVPFIVVNGKHGLSGAQPLAKIEEMIDKIMKEENEIKLENMVPGKGGETCSLDDEGNWNCD